MAKLTIRPDTVITLWELSMVKVTGAACPVRIKLSSKHDIATQVTIIRFFMEVKYAMGWILSMG
jgi:hypothetical protein